MERWLKPMRWRLAVWLFGLGLLAATASAEAGPGASSPAIDLANAQWFLDPGFGNGPGAMAGPLLVTEVKRRTGIRLERALSLDDGERPIIALLQKRAPPRTTNDLQQRLRSAANGAGPTRAEGFEIFIDRAARKGPTIVLVGADGRGTLYAVGTLLRQLDWRPGSCRISADLRLDTAPAAPIRGHQLGYRDSANSYDAWDVPQFEAYIRDLLVFGCNSIELIPPLERTAPRNRHMPKSPWDMTVALSSLLDQYGMDVWFWAPIEQTDVTKPDQAAAFLHKRDELFRACKRIDAIFVPGGDPGDTPPELLFPFLERLTAVLHQSHPHAQVWVSPQMFDTAELERFFQYLEKHQPGWLTGVIYGPWIWASLEETRRRVPARYPIRNYPDITHTVRCQFPVPNFDQALALTLGREPINPRPRAYARIHQLQVPLTAGAITYSDGVNDDVNKFVWSVLDWDPGHDVQDALRQYGRYFFGPDSAEAVAQGLFGLEENLVGKASQSQTIPQTLAHWQQLEAKATPAQRLNWRFQQALFRAYFDALVADRARVEAALEARALKALASGTDPSAQVSAARRILAEADRHATSPHLRQRVLALAEALYQSIGMQLDTKRYGAAGAERGAVLDYLDEPLNNRRWLEARFHEIDRAPTVDERRRQAQALAAYEDPGPGGFYDDLGDPDRQPHLVVDERWENDPGFLRSPQCEHNLWNGARLSWLTQAETLYHQPLRLRYDGLDRNGAYRVRIVYFGRFHARMQLEVNGRLVHGPLEPAQTLSAGLPRPVEFAIPQEASATGTIELVWRRLSGRGCQVAEVFLLKGS